MHEQFLKRLREIGNAHPELKKHIQEVYSLAMAEIEDGGSESNEISLAFNSIQEEADKLGIKIKW